MKKREANREVMAKEREGAEADRSQRANQSCSAGFYPNVPAFPARRGNLILAPNLTRTGDVFRYHRIAVVNDFARSGNADFELFADGNVSAGCAGG